MSGSEELLTFLKALADANRLKIVGLLAQQPYTVEQLSAVLGLGESTVSHHLSRLSDARLVTATAQSYYNFYRLETTRLEEMARRLLTPDTLAEAAPEVDAGAFDRKVVSHYLQPDGKLKTIPSQRKKLIIVLRYIVQRFEPGKRYSERQVNEILARFYSDTATLRRELVGFGLMAREGGGGDYWRLEEMHTETILSSSTKGG